MKNNEMTRRTQIRARDAALNQYHRRAIHTTMRFAFGRNAHYEYREFYEGKLEIAVPF